MIITHKPRIFAHKSHTQPTTSVEILFHKHHQPRENENNEYISLKISYIPVKNGQIKVNISHLSIKIEENKS